MKDAEEHAEQDRRQREEVELRNSADQLAYGAEKMLRDNADKIPEELTKEIQGKVDALREAHKSGDMAQIPSRMEELSAAMQQVGAHVYQTAGADGASEEGPVPDGLLGRPGPAVWTARRGPWRASSGRSRRTETSSSKTARVRPVQRGGDSE